MTGDCMAEATDKTPRMPAREVKKPSRRSRVGNGKTLVSGADPRTSIYREFQDEVADLVAHMGGNPTAAQFDIIEEAADLKVKLRASRKARIVNGEATIPDVTCCTMINALRRQLVDLGLEARMADVIPGDALEQFFAERRKKATDAETIDG